MTLKVEKTPLPSSDSGDLHLAHPTEEELLKIWTDTFVAWGDSLELPEYLRESQFLTTIPLARDGGMTRWVLVDKNLAPNERPILCSCETFYKRSLMSNANGEIEDVIVHGIASVFCPEEYRGRGYGSRHMKELARTLRNWQSGTHKVAGSVLYSDIGKVYYSKLGWAPTPTNTHFEFPSVKGPKSPLVRDIAQDDLPELCKRDEAMVRSAMATPAPGMQQRVVILPDLDHMLWHLAKEDFATDHLFKKQAKAKGAIAGPPGKQVWAVWTHRYYGRHDAEAADNTLYILRLVVEGDKSANRASSSEQGTASLPDEQVTYLEAVLQAAQAEAAEWHLDLVKLWEPPRCVAQAISHGRISHTVVERVNDSIASCMWYDDDGDDTNISPVWINNEHYAWC